VSWLGQNSLKIKDAFPKLSLNKVSEIHNIMNKSLQKGKPKLSMTSKDSFRKQIIILMGTNNVERVMVQSNAHIANINWLLKGIKFEVSANYIWLNSKDIVVTTNKVAISSDLNMVEKYIKKLNNINVSDVMSPKLPQLKSYLKILGIPYFIEDTNLLIMLYIIKRIIKTSHIFNDIILVS